VDHAQRKKAKIYGGSKDGDGDGDGDGDAIPVA
jgi:hypothetical protein